MLNNFFSHNTQLPFKSGCATSVEQRKHVIGLAHAEKKYIKIVSKRFFSKLQLKSKYTSKKYRCLQQTNLQKNHKITDHSFL